MQLSVLKGVFMLSPRVEKEMNFALNREYYSKFFYLSMAAYVSARNLDGFANFFQIQQQEEEFHANKVFNYLLDRGGKVKIAAIEQPPIEFSSPEQLFTLARKHEAEVTAGYNSLMDVAIQEKDHATESFLQWFLDEQVEEENMFAGLVGKLELNGGNGAGLLMIDTELAKRVFTQSQVA